MFKIPGGIYLSNSTAVHLPGTGNNQIIKRWSKAFYKKTAWNTQTILHISIVLLTVT